jgi:hypothetical protein
MRMITTLIFAATFGFISSGQALMGGQALTADEKELKRIEL